VFDDIVLIPYVAGGILHSLVPESRGGSIYLEYFEEVSSEKFGGVLTDIICSRLYTCSLRARLRSSSCLTLIFSSLNNVSSAHSLRPSPVLSIGPSDNASLASCI
jgi:hypothetical protein